MVLLFSSLLIYSFTLLECTEAYIMPMKILGDYFKSYNIERVVLLLCPKNDIKVDILRYLSRKGFTVTFSIDNVEDLPHIRSGGVLELNCDFSYDAITKFTKERSFGVHTEWLLLDQVNNTDNFQISDGVKKLEDAYILPSSCVTLAQISSDEVAYFDMFRVSVFRPLEYTLMSKQPLDSFTPLPPRKNRYNLQGITLTAAAVFYHPKRFYGFDSYEHPEVDTIPKVNHPIVKTLTEQLNFSITLIILDDYGWQTNMTFSGLIGLLQREEIDMGATGVFMRPDRIVTIDFTGDTFEIMSKLIFKQPALSSVSNIFVLPFTQMVWVSCSALASITAVLLIIDALVTVGNRQAFYEAATPWDIITIIIGCVCQQGPYLMPKSGSSKIILFLFSLCAMFFYTSYSANIVALLQSTSPTLKSLSDLTNSPLSVGIQNVIYNQIYFAEATDKEITDLYKKKIAPQGSKAFLPPEEGIKKVRSGLYAYEVETHWGYKIISDTFLESEKCVIDEMRLFLLPMTSIPVIKKSGYREIFTVKNTLQRDMGIHSRIRRRWLPSKPECDSRGGGYVSVALTDFKPALLVILYGFLVSFIVFVAEIIYHIRSKMKHRGKAGINKVWGSDFKKKQLI